MVLDPISLGIGVISAGLGVGQSIAGNQAAKQDYANQKALSDATGRFNSWQANQNARMTDLNNQYQYWSQKVQYNQDLAYVNQMRNYDLSMEIAQAKKVGDTRAAAGADYAINSQALAQKFQEEGMARAVGMQQYQYRVLQQSAAFQNAASEGQSSDRIVRDFARQEDDYQTLQQINQGLSERQYNRDQLSRITNYLSQYNSQDFYKAAQRMDPVMPFAPLPTLVMPPGPSMTGAAPGNAGMWLGAGTAVLGGVNSYFSSAASIKKAVA
jgi:hypothetical protein